MTRQVGDFRNIALVGHAASGKTTLGEAILLKAGVTSRLGNVNDGSSVLDFDEESKDRKHSVDSTVFFSEHGGKLLNLIDTPGMPDHCGVALAALAAVETALIVISASSGIGVNTRRMANAAKEYGLARMIVINRIDADNVDLEQLYHAIRETFGPQCHAINLPADGGRKVLNVYANEGGQSDILDAAEIHKEIVEAIVETDESLMEAYMETGAASLEQLGPAMAAACARGELVPVMFTSATSGIGIAELMDAMVAFAPSPIVGKQRVLVHGDGADARHTPVDPAGGDFVGQVFKITSDPKSHIKYTAVRVLSGSLKGDGNLCVSGGGGRGQRPGHIFKLRAAEHTEVSEAVSGDIVAFAKLELPFGAAVFAKAEDGRIEMPKLPTPMFSLALEPKARGDVEKISVALHRFAEEDPCFQYHRDSDTGDLLISGMGDMHLTVIRSRMKRNFKLEVDTKPPKIPYRETIAGSAKYVEYTHKKQSGGAGQYAKVVVDMEPNERGAGYEFVDKIFGGVIDQAFRPSVDKGVRDQMKKGVIAGYPVVDVKVSLVDGKTHPVDSKDIAFQIAGRQVFKKAFVQCKPILLEPVVSIEINIPAENVGDITRDLAGKRGQIVGQDMLPGNQILIRGTVPLGEVSNYSSQLKSVTGGQGSYSMEFSHYDVVPPNVQQQIVAQHKVADEEEEG